MHGKRAAAILSLLCLGAGADQQQTELEAVRETLRGARRFDYPAPMTPKIPIKLDGYYFHWEVDVGAGKRVILVSRMGGGTLLAFAADGSLLGRKETDEPTWMGLFDFDDLDGIAEIMTEEVKGRGTAFVLKRFHVYGVGDQGPRDLWQADSLERSEDKTVRGFIRCEPSGSGVPYARLTYFRETRQGGKTSLERFSFAFRNGTFKEVPWAE